MVLNTCAECSFRTDESMHAWAVRIVATGLFHTGVLIASDAKAETLALKCSIGGQEAAATFNIDVTNGTIDLGRGSHPGRGEQGHGWLV
jgi:hypothetical protein